MASPSLSALLRERLQRAAVLLTALERLAEEAEALETDVLTLADFAGKTIAAADAIGGAVVSDDVRAAIERRRSREGGRG